MKFYQEVHFVNVKHLKKFREVSDTNDGVSSIFLHPFWFHENTLSLKTATNGKNRCCRLRLSTAKYTKHDFENHFVQMQIPILTMYKVSLGQYL